MTGWSNTPADLIQALPNSRRWALADSALLQAIARQERIERGPRGSTLASWMRVADRLNLAYMLMLTVGLAQVIIEWWRHRGVVPLWTPVTRLFVGFGAGAEEGLFGKYQAESAASVGRISQVDPSSLGRIHRIGLFDAIRALHRAGRQAVEAVASLPPSLTEARTQFQTFATMRVGHFAFTRAWFSSLLQRYPGLGEVCFIAADSAAFAAVDAGLRTRYLQHGFIRHSLVFPDFAAVDALTRDEAEHLERRLPGAHVSLVRSMGVGQRDHRGGILVASVYEQPAEMQRVTPFLQWAKSQGWQVVVRRHPRETGAFWNNDMLQALAVIDDGDCSFEVALERLRPRVVVSWYSTALADALYAGIVPVTVSDQSHPAVGDMVYPLSKRALRWPQDSGTLATIMRDDESYQSVLRSLQGRRGASDG